MSFSYLLISFFNLNIRVNFALLKPNIFILKISEGKKVCEEEEVFLVDEEVCLVDSLMDVKEFVIIWRFDKGENKKRG